MVETRPTASGPIARTTLLALAGVGVVASLLYWFYWTPYGVDDQWITFRYAENIAAGRGFVYNLGERVMGTSTPLYTLVLAVAKLAGLPVPITSWTIGYAAMITAIVLLFQIVRRLHSDGAGFVAAALLAGGELFGRAATDGMETPLYIVLILATFLLYLTGRELTAAVFAALCLLTRLDGGAVGVVLMVVHLVTRRAVPWKAGLVYLAVALPWFLFSLAYFDSLVPNSMIAKRLHSQHTILWWMPKFLIREPRTYLAVIGAIIALRAPATRAGSLLLVVWATIYALAFSLSGIHAYPWYRTPLLAVLAGGAGIGVMAIASWLARPGRSRVGLAALVSGLALVPDGTLVWRRVTGDEPDLNKLRFEAAVWMRDSLPAGVPIATGGIGLVGYHTGRTIHDAMGLVTPKSMRYRGRLANPRAIAIPRFLRAVIEDYDPEYVFDLFWLPKSEDTPRFMQERYRVLRTWRLEDPSQPQFHLYQRLSKDSLGVGSTQ